MADEARLIIRMEGSGGGGSSPGGGGMPSPSPSPGSGGNGASGGGSSNPAIDPPQKQEPQSLTIIKDILQQTGFTPHPLVSQALQAANRALPRMDFLSAQEKAALLPGGLAAAGIATAAVVGYRASYGNAVDQVGNFSGDLEMARAESEVRRVNRQLSAAAMFGDELAGIERARGRQADAFFNLTAPWQEKALKDIETIALASAEFMDFLSKNRETVETIIYILAYPSGLPALQSLIPELRKWLGMQDEEAKRSNGIRDAFLRYDHLPLPPQFVLGDVVADAVGFDGPVLDMDFS